MKYILRIKSFPSNFTIIPLFIFLIIFLIQVCTATNGLAQQLPPEETHFDFSQYKDLYWLKENLEKNKISAPQKQSDVIDNKKVEVTNTHEDQGGISQKEGFAEGADLEHPESHDKEGAAISLDKNLEDHKDKTVQDSHEAQGDQDAHATQSDKSNSWGIPDQNALKNINSTHSENSKDVAFPERNLSNRLAGKVNKDKQTHAENSKIDLKSPRKDHENANDHDSNLESESEEQTMLLSQYWERERDKLIQKARLCRKLQNYDEAERCYIKVLNYEMDDALRQNLMLEMIDLLMERQSIAKVVIVYEKFIEQFPRASILTDIYTKLGRLYREIGAFDMAVARFYQVLNASLSIAPEEMTAYKAKTDEAQYEIAYTYVQMERYRDALTFFQRLKKVNLHPSMRQMVLFNIGYCSFKLEAYSDVILELEDLLKHYPDSVVAPESHYILSSTYRIINEPQKAMNEVMQLLKHSEVDLAGDKELWLYWQKKTANQAANEFYERGDYLNALKIYQVMVPLNENPDWQIPVLYQIGLCFERLNMYKKAHEAYSLITSDQEWKKGENQLNETTQSIRDMAKWRLDQLKWNSDIEKKLENFLSLPDASGVQKT